MTNFDVTGHCDQYSFPADDKGIVNDADYRSYHACSKQR